MPNYNLRGINVSFPFEAYECQKTYMESVIKCLQERTNGLLESPTGTGKSLSLLCAALAWRASQTSEFTPKIVYASRTHSQLAQVIGQLKRTSYSPRVCVLGSREQLCIHKEVSKLQSNAARTAVCKTKVSKRQCSYFHRVQELSKTVIAVMDVEELVAYGEEKTVCPYYLSREMLNDADLIFMPYNYLVDGRLRAGQNIDLTDAIVIFDEAHNVDSSCGEATSFDLAVSDIASCAHEIQRAMEIANAPGYNGDYDSECMQMILDGVKKTEHIVRTVALVGDRLVQNGEYLYSLLDSAGISDETHLSFIDILEEVVRILATLPSFSHGRCASALFLQALQTAFKSEKMQRKLQTKFFKVHIADEVLSDARQIQQNGSSVKRTLSFWCFNPGVVMLELQQKGVRSMILTSGTLSPLNSFADELSVPFPVRLENAHVIDPCQVFVGAIAKGPSGVALNSSFASRDSAEYKSDLGNALVEMCRIVPDGLLVFFPSYAVMDKCIEAWQRKGQSVGFNSMCVWERMEKHKTPIVEPKDKNKFHDAMAQFNQKLKKLNGCVFFAVCRGKVSEGLDFADEKGRAVVVTGLPFPAVKDAKVELKKKYVDERRLKGFTGNDWYTQQASRAVNQAVGRVIRHRNDYGAIIFCDERFKEKSAVSQMSAWIRPQFKQFDEFDTFKETLAKFFQGRKNNGVKRSREIDVEDFQPIDRPNPISNQNQRIVSEAETAETAVKFDQAKTFFKSSITTKVEPKSMMATIASKNTTETVSFLRPAIPSSFISSNETRDKAQEYIRQVKTSLSADDFGRFQGYLRALRSDKVSIELLIGQLSALFEQCGIGELLRGLSAFLPPRILPFFEDFIARSKSEKDVKQRRIEEIE